MALRLNGCQRFEAYGMSTALRLIGCGRPRSLWDDNDIEAYWMTTALRLIGC